MVAEDTLQHFADLPRLQRVPGEHRLALEREQRARASRRGGPPRSCSRGRGVRSIGAVFRTNQPSPVRRYGEAALLR